jgi:hypothetical protein
MYRAQAGLYQGGGEEQELILAAIRLTEQGMSVSADCWRVSSTGQPYYRKRCARALCHWSIGV